MQWNAQDITDWLLTKGPSMPHLEALTYTLADKLIEVGAPLWRLRLAMRTVHPLVTAVSTIWERETGPQDVFVSPHGLEQRASFQDSPMSVVSQTRAPLRQDLACLTREDHLAFHELRERGATDYFGIPLVYGDHMGGIMIAVTDATDGFSDHDIEGLLTIAKALAPLVEVRRLTILSKAVASAYLGPTTGHRVLGGEITRGHVDQIDAAILISDLRGWTKLNAERPVEEVVEVANQYFEILDTAVKSNGGEILKFMGDGVLAIFPAEGHQAQAVANAKAAALSALSHQSDVLQFGIGLHVGTVLYGNVGSEARLDFTVLGTAVNMAARIEALCSQSGCPILMSKDFADLSGSSTHLIGRFDLKGLEGKLPIFTF